MEQSNIMNNNVTVKLISANLSLLIFCIPLLVNKNVNYFRANQVAWLTLFTLTGIFLYIVKYINTKELIWTKSLLNPLIFLFTIVMTFSLLLSDYPLVSIRDYIIFLSYFIIFFIVISNISNLKRFNFFIKLFFVTSFLVSSYTILHYYGLISYLQEYGQILSTIGQKNLTSNYISLIMPIVFCFMLIEENKKNKILYFLIMIINYIALMICQSRGIWISIICTIVLAIFLIYLFNLFNPFKENKKWLLLLLFSFLIITATYSTENVLNKNTVKIPQRALSTFDEQDSSINTRLLIWRTTFEMIKEKPLFGSGIGTFKMNYLDYKADYLKRNPSYSKFSSNPNETHNEYLQIFAELGIIGISIFLLIFLSLYVLFVNYFKNKNINLEKKIIALGIFMGINCFLLHSLFSFPLHVPALGSAFFIIVALAVVYMNHFKLFVYKKNNYTENVIKSGGKRLDKLILVLIFLFIIFLAESLVIRPYLAEVNAYNGYNYFISGYYEKAMYDYEYANQLDPYNGRIALSLGATYYNLAMFDKAENILINSKDLINDKSIYRNLGLCYKQMGKYVEAEENFKHAIYLDPKYYLAYDNLASLYIQKNEYEKAIETWKKAIDLGLEFKEKHIFLYYIGISYQRIDMQGEAYNYFLEALKEAPDDSPIMEDIEQELLKIYQSTNVPE